MSNPDQGAPNAALAAEGTPPDRDTRAPQGAQASVAPLPPFSQLVDSATAAPRWSRWVGRLNHYFRATRETDGAVKGR